MAHGNLFLGQARGSIGDVVFWRGNNEQLSRARNRRPANPRTDPQLTSRILLKTVSLAYSQFMFDFANQTFQGASNPRDNQRRFLSANIRKMRQRISEGATGDMNFAYRDDTTALLNRYTVSEGILPSVIYTMTSSGGASAIAFGNAFLSAGEDPTYQEICDSLGLAAGSQLTFMLVRANQGVIEFVKRARIVLSPASGDMSTAFLTAGGAINDPNPENDFNIGTFTWTRSSATTGELGISLVTDYQALAIVASYNDGSGWKYSWQELWYDPTAGYGTHSLQVAIDSWKTEVSGSEKYTQQANVPASGVVYARATLIQRQTSSGSPVSTTEYSYPVGGGAINGASEQGYNTIEFVFNGVTSGEYSIESDLDAVTDSYSDGVLNVTVNGPVGGAVQEWPSGYVSITVGTDVYAFIVTNI